MNSAAIAIIACLWAQAPGEGDRYEPQLRPTQKAPAARLEETPADDAPDPQIKHDGEASERSSAADEDSGGALRVGHSDAEADDRLAPVDAQAKQRLRPPELLAEALETLKSGALVGTPLTLQAALARSTDRQQQLRIAQTYWKLCTAQVEYHWARDQRDLLGHYTQSETNQPGMLSARASARADVRDAQLAVAQAQQELSDLMAARADASPPLASDRPHVGDYNTHYESIFTSRVPPPRIRLIHRVLPGRRKAIDAHAEAIVASLDALETTGEDFRQNGRGLATVLAMLEQLKRERRAFSADVRAYNQEIAEYAFAVAPPGANGETLVSMLIKTAPRSQDPPRNRSGSRGRSRADQGDSQFERSAGDETAAAREQMANYQPTDDEKGVYQGLLDVDPALRVQKLANLLHWDRNLPSDGSEPATLADCLRGVPANRRMNVISAFWQAREKAARYQALADQVEQLATLPALAINLRREPGLGVRVQATRRAARAALADAHVQLLAAEFELTEAVGRRFDDPWLLPSTPPQSGRYLVAVNNRSFRGAMSPRLGELVRLQHEKLEERADGVIQADVQRAALMTESRRSEPADTANRAADADDPMPLDVALRAVARQNQETLAFLHDLTEYNMAIARFALAVWPSGISNDELVKKLVIARSTRRDT
jgi:hypothetical protein